ncbi:MAG: chorismate mutase [Candidatus Limnocylindria bacterium]
MTGQGVRGVRGATTTVNDPKAVVAATGELLEQLVSRNDLRSGDVAYVLFTVTPDLDAAFPASAARLGLGWDDVPVICAREIPVPGALAGCIRVLVVWNTTKAQSEVRHAYLHGARALRPDWSVDLPGDAPLAAAVRTESRD